MKRIYIVEFTKASIRRKVHSVYLARGVFSTLSNVVNALEGRMTLLSVAKATLEKSKGVDILRGFRKII